MASLVTYSILMLMLFASDIVSDLDGHCMCKRLGSNVDAWCCEVSKQLIAIHVLGKTLNNPACV